MMKRLRTGKGIPVLSEWGKGEIVRSCISLMSGEREYEIRLAPAHFVYLPRSDFELAETVISFRALAELKTLESEGEL